MLLNDRIFLLNSCFPLLRAILFHLLSFRDHYFWISFWSGMNDFWFSGLTGSAVLFLSDWNLLSFIVSLCIVIFNLWRSSISSWSFYLNDLVLLELFLLLRLLFSRLAFFLVRLSLILLPGRFFIRRTISTLTCSDLVCLSLSSI